MYSAFDSIFSKVVLTSVSILLALVLYFLYSYTYWWRKNVFYLKPTLPFGNFKMLLTGKQHTTEVTREIYRQIKANGQKYGGLYFLHTPVFMPTDPALIKKVLTSDFEYFSDRGVGFNSEKDPLAKHLFNLPTEPWRILRSKLTPAFSSAKMKNMFDIIHLCSTDLVELTENKLGQPVEINELTVRYTVDTIGRCAFGIECNSLKNPKEIFRQIGERVLNPPMFNGLKFFIALISPTIIKLGNLRIMEKDITQFFLNVVEQNIVYRESNNIQRSDFFQLILDMKNNEEKLGNNSEMKMTSKLMAAQAFVFFAAGFETSAMTINLCLLELSQNLEHQDKVRAEIKKVMKAHSGKISYDSIKDMVYLDQCIQETLRKHPPLGFLNRVCNKNYKIPDTDIVIEKGTKVLISLLGLQSDPEYFPDPEKFDPERFSDANKEKITQYTNMPFGEGHRICIGMRFGLMQTKVGLAAMLSNLEFKLNPMTKLPLTYIPQSFVISLKNPIYLDVKKL